MFHKIPRWFQNLFAGYTWNKQTDEKVIYLTFDDGPIPDTTEWVLDVLAAHNVKATFFVVGENIERHPSVFQKVINGGYSIGNHTYHHLKGWGASLQNYLADVEQCSQLIKKYTGETPHLFRPPHGQIKPAQAKQLRTKYELIMWDTLTIDYDKNLSEKKCLKNSIKATQPGSIIVFHDSVKASKNLKYVLPRYIAHYKAQGFMFKSL